MMKIKLIRTEEDYQQALEQLEELMDAMPVPAFLSR